MKLNLVHPVNLLCILILILSLENCQNQYEEVNYIPLTDWKFKASEDNLEFKSKDFNDSNWRQIKAGYYSIYSQYPPFDSYAWYRCSVSIPEELKESWRGKENLQLVMDSIPSTYQLYINGKLVQNQKEILPSDTSKISISLSGYVKSLLGGDKAQIDLCVFTLNGKGVINKSVPVISLRSLADSVFFNKETFYQVNGAKLTDTTLTVKNLSNTTINGVLEMQFENKTNNFFYKKKVLLNALPGAEQKFPISVPITEDEVKVTIVYKDDIRKASFLLEEWKRLPYVLYKSIRQKQ